MASAIAEPRPDVGETAPKIVGFEIPLDKIGEVIGPKGKVINAIQQETGADIAVDDDGMVGRVTIGSRDGGAVKEARRRIELILDPPTAQVGEVYSGRVVNVTKFGAFVNILPGRDGLVHISKLGRGKRVDRVEDVLNLGDAVEVRVDDIDPQGKVSLTPVGDADGDAPAGNGGSSGSGAVAGRSGPAPDPVATTASAAGAAAVSSGGGGDVQTVSFEDAFDAEIRDELGDLGPATRTGGGEGGERRGGGGGGRRRGGGGGGGGRGRRS
jgi:polyribonucleotide nucleotidyltransferase